MATQGLVSIVDKDGKTLVKIVAGCNGYNAEALQQILKSADTLPPVGIISGFAQMVNFGCDDCLVIQSNQDHFMTNDVDFGAAEIDPTHDRYVEKFSDPRFNPRWESGTVDYYLEVLAACEAPAANGEGAGDQIAVSD